jgi:hypothetical protein
MRRAARFSELSGSAALLWFGVSRPKSGCGKIQVLEGYGLKSVCEYSEKNRRSLHYAPPDFLSRPVALGICMRLSLRRAAHVVVASSAK